MNRIVGIDLGTTNSLVAVVDSGIPMVLADPDGHRLTPSVVHYPGDGSPPVVGRAAARARTADPERTVSSIKRFIGRRRNEITEEEAAVPYRLGDSDGRATVAMGQDWFLPEQISAEVLSRLKRDAESFLGEPVTRAVITVPAYFNDAQRSATKRAGEIAGLTVERIVNEPTAAALAYGLNRLKEKSRIAVYDLGGGTFDITLLELREGVFQVLATNGNTRLGGDDIDRRVVEYLAAEALRAGGLSGLSLQAQARLREASEEAKIALSEREEFDISLPFLAPGCSFRHRLTRQKLEELAQAVVQRTRSHCLRSLADAKLEAKELDQVILVGGQTRMPLVRRFVAEVFGCAEFEGIGGGLLAGAGHAREGPLLNTSQNPDEVVALGAAVQGEILSGGFKEMLLLDVTPLSLGIETFGGLMNVIIPRNSTIPVKAGEAFTTAVDFQKSMLIHVVQGERERVKDNWSLGQFTVEFEPLPKGVARVGVQFEIDANGILHVLARDIRTGRDRVVEMRSVVDLDDQDVQRMVEESVEYAFDDLRVRQWTEAKLRAEETAAAARKALGEFGDQLAADVRAATEGALLQLEQALARGEEELSTAAIQGLKEAHAGLDHATGPLADLLMQRAVDDALRRRGLA